METIPPVTWFPVGEPIQQVLSCSDRERPARSCVGERDARGPEGMSTCFLSVARVTAGRYGRRQRAGVLLTFDEFISGTEIFGERIQPLMNCRRHVTPLARAAE